MSVIHNIEYCILQYIKKGGDFYPSDELRSSIERFHQQLTFLSHSIAKKIRTKEHGIGGQDQEMEFEIRTPQGHPWMYSLPNTGWRMQWKFYSA